MKNLFTCALLLLVLVLSTNTIAQTTYKMPPPEVAALVDAPANPAMTLSPDRSIALLLHGRGVPTISDLAQPEYRLAGIRINPRTNGPSRSGYTTRIVIKNLADLSERDVLGLPSDPIIQNISFAPDGKNIAFTLTMDQHIELWIATIASGQARKLGDFRVNNVWSGTPYDWYPDSQRLLVRTVPNSRGVEPVRPIAPSGPTIQDASGEAAPARTYQDLLSDEHDVALFDHFFTSQLIVVSLNGNATVYGQPHVFSSTSISPDGRYSLISFLNKPYSYTVPANRFPLTTQVWDHQGRLVSTIEELPLLDNIPISFNSTWEGRRSIGWRSDAASTLFFVEAQDGGNPVNQTDIRDIAYLLEAPFNGSSRELAKLSTRFAGVVWGSNNLALISETWRATRTTKTWILEPGNPSTPARLAFDRNYEDQYNNPGSPVMRAIGNGYSVIHVVNNGTEILMSGQGASPEGLRPFLRAFNPSTGEFRELWRSEAPYFATVAAIGNDDASQIIVRRETNDTPGNFIEVNLASGATRTLTNFPHPTPELKDVQSEFVTYYREDGLTLTGQLLLPSGYNPATDGALPLMLWAYPREFASADAAGQVTDSPHRFNAISYWGPHFLVTQGYAVLNNAAMPIVAPAPDVEPNDNFLEQLVGNAKAAIDYLADRGIADPQRVAVGGHSYGAFMTANLLAHSDLFKAGVARSGAYNRSLTPFGFQAEPRSIWEARDTYIDMSPFFYAHQIKTPILFIHGEADNNSGTFPIQSERMFQAVRGNGGTARLVMLPHESHGYTARESLMHMLWETVEWLDRYVK
jgi:dipeptidyl aminopeptidase/acylaminoacyl peptidase